MDMSLNAFFRKFICSLAVYALVMCQPCFAGPTCAKLFNTTTSKLSKGKLQKLLNAEDYNGEEIIDYLSGDPQLKELFEASAGVWEGYSIKTHTLMVFKVFAEQFALYKKQYKFRVLSDVRLFETLKFTIALHDIGKPYAIDQGNKDRQHEYTLPILEEVFSRFDFSENETKLAKALVSNDFMGDLVRGIIDPKTAKRKFTKIAKEAGMSLADYVPLQFLFYTIDAGSYPSLRQTVFTTTRSGLLIPNKSQFEELWEMLSSSDKSKTEDVPDPKEAEDLATRKRIFAIKKVTPIKANGKYMHQVLGMKNNNFDQKTWYKKMKSILSMEPSSVKDALKDFWLSTSYQKVIWTTKGGVWVHEETKKLRVKMTFKENYVFVSEYDAQKLFGVKQDPDSYAAQKIVGIVNVNGFYKIVDLTGLKEIEITDPQNKLKPITISF
jgi:hypothetical protein